MITHIFQGFSDDLWTHHTRVNENSPVVFVDEIGCYDEVPDPYVIHTIYHGHRVGLIVGAFFDDRGHWNIHATQLNDERPVHWSVRITFDKEKDPMSGTHPAYRNGLYVIAPNSAMVQNLNKRQLDRMLSEIDDRNRTSIRGT